MAKKKKPKKTKEAKFFQIMVWTPTDLQGKKKKRKKIRFYPWSEETYIGLQINNNRR